MSTQVTAALRRGQNVAPARKENPFRLSRNALAVLDELRGSTQPQKAYSLLERLYEGGIHSPMSVYRALDQLIARGLARKIQSLNAFIALETPADKPVAFVICRTCGKTAVEPLDHFGQAWLEKSGLEFTSTYIESYRDCVGC